ncbi:ABC transporter [Nocardioides sp. CF8]|nr:ABC transporter [Nocardioides sp. CF8]
MVSLDGTSQIAAGDEAEIYVDASKMHLFDPSTGENLTVDESRAGRIPEREDPRAAQEAEQMADQGEEVHSADSEPRA